jgi:hypothetical protein
VLLFLARAQLSAMSSSDSGLRAPRAGALRIKAIFLVLWQRSKMQQYLTRNLRHIDIQHITHAARYVTGYGMKALKRPTFSLDHVLVLPKTLDELPT